MPRRSTGCIPLAAAALVAAAGCTVVPPRGFPPSEEREVVVDHRLPGGGPAWVRVPASAPGLTVLWMQTDPPVLREVFEEGERRILVDGDRLTIHCRYRVYARPAGEGQAPVLRSPEELFPDASSVRTVHQD